MANKKISELPNGAALSGGELVELVQSGSNVKVTTQQIADLASGGASDWGYIGGTITDQTDLVAYVEAQITAAVAGLMDLRSPYDASGGAYPSSGGSGTAGAILKGDAYPISVAGTLPTGQVVSVGDLIYALVDSPGNTQANWGRLEMNLMQATSSVAGIIKLYTNLSASNTDGSVTQAAIKAEVDQIKNLQTIGGMGLA